MMPLPPGKLKYDALELKGVDENPCDVVPLRGYLRKGTGDRDRLYPDPVSRRRWTEIHRNDIEAQTLVEDEHGRKNGSVVWVKRSATVLKCGSVLASEHDGQPRAGDEDLGAWRYPY